VTESSGDKEIKNKVQLALQKENCHDKIAVFTENFAGRLILRLNVQKC